MAVSDFSLLEEEPPDFTPASNGKAKEGPTCCGRRRSSLDGGMSTKSPRPASFNNLSIGSCRMALANACSEAGFGLIETTCGEMLHDATLGSWTRLLSCGERSHHSS
jgi:hypothetical protein